jgi:hypothetical protein
MSDRLTTVIALASGLLALVPAFTALVDVSIAVRLGVVGLMLVIALLALLAKLQFRSEGSSLQVFTPQPSVRWPKALAGSLYRILILALCVAIAVAVLLFTIRFHNVTISDLEEGVGIHIRAPHIPVASVRIRPTPTASQQCAPNNPNPSVPVAKTMENWPGITAAMEIEGFVYPQSIRLICGAPVTGVEFVILTQPTTASVVDAATRRRFQTWLGIIALITLVLGSATLVRSFAAARRS